MALTDKQVRSAKPSDKPYKLVNTLDLYLPGSLNINSLLLRSLILLNQTPANYVNGYVSIRPK